MGEALQQQSLVPGLLQGLQVPPEQVLHQGRLVAELRLQDGLGLARQLLGLIRGEALAPAS